jgi:hypothetical protein
MSQGAKSIHLPSPMPKERFVAKLAATLQADSQAEAPAPEPKIGEKMPDSTLYASISPDTGRAMHAMPIDAPLTLTFNEAQKYAQCVSAQKTYGHDDWRLPTKNELNVLFNNRAAIGGFNVSGSDRAGWYWSSSSSHKWGAWGQRFKDGYQDYNVYKDVDSSVRLIRYGTEEEPARRLREAVDLLKRAITPRALL